MRVSHSYGLLLCFSLKVQEEKLDKIAQEQGSSVQEFVSIVKENQKTLDGLKVGFSDVLRDGHVVVWMLVGRYSLPLPCFCLTEVRPSRHGANLYFGCARK